ncbi:hypothetical protein B0H19DRAFT_1056634 [Mycena capillaripes]|nr:hypothetical protein B0H19DRAFT_1056634 [Mycena capillaripes]
MSYRQIFNSIPTTIQTQIEALLDYRAQGLPPEVVQHSTEVRQAPHSSTTSTQWLPPPAGLRDASAGARPRREIKSADEIGQFFRDMGNILGTIMETREFLHGQTKIIIYSRARHSKGYTTRHFTAIFMCRNGSSTSSLSKFGSSDWSDSESGKPLPDKVLIGKIKPFSKIETVSDGGCLSLHAILYKRLLGQFTAGSSPPARKREKSFVAKV